MSEERQAVTLMARLAIGIEGRDSSSVYFSRLHRTRPFPAEPVGTLAGFERGPNLPDTAKSSWPLLGLCAW